MLQPIAQQPQPIAQQPQPIVQQPIVNTESQDTESQDSKDSKDYQKIERNPSKPEYLVKAQIIRKLLDFLEWPMGESGQTLVVNGGL